MDCKPIRQYIALNPKEKDIIESFLAYYCGLYWVSFIDKEDFLAQAKENLKISLPFIFAPFIELIKKTYRSVETR